jgi:hypothetical protein
MKSFPEMLKVLESISAGYENSAAHYEVLRLAGFALLYLQKEQRWDAFEQFVTRCQEGSLSPDEKDLLQKWGIELG